MKMHLKNWRNRFANSTLKAIALLISTTGLNSQPEAAAEIAAQLCHAPIKVTPDHTYNTYAYQWASWSEDWSE